MEVKEIQTVPQPEQYILPEPTKHKSESEKSLSLAEIDVRGSGKKKMSGLKELTKALQEINKALKPKNFALNYSVDDSTDAIVVKVIDKQTDKVIRQIPPEEVLNLRGHIKEFLGAIYDQNG